MLTNFITIVALLALTFSVHQSAAGLAEISSRIVCAPRDYLIPVQQSECQPSFTLPLKACNSLMRRCTCQHNIHMKWTAEGCANQRGDGGCQCLEYCGWKCRTKCLADPEKRCEWVNNGCKNKVTGGTGPLTVCFESSPINLRTAANFVILTKAGISNVPLSRIVGNIGVSPIGFEAITGFSLVRVPATGPSASSINVVGRVFAANYGTPTPNLLTVAINHMETAYTTAAGLPFDISEFATGNLGGLTLSPGVYRWGTDVNIPTDITISGASNAIWIFQIAGNVIQGSASKIILSGGAQAKNIIWQVAGMVDIGTNAHFEGIVLCQTSISLKTGATMNGRLFAQTAVSLDTNKVIRPL